MTQPRVVGMTINHRELDHILTSIADVIRNTAYHVAKLNNPEFFDEDGNLTVMEESSVKALLQDSLDHYIQFTAGSGNSVNTHMDFNYYLEDNFQMVANVIKADPAKFSYVSALFAQACGVLSNAIAPAIEDVVQTGQSVERIEAFTMGADNSYYVIHGEPDTEHDEEPLSNLCEMALVGGFNVDGKLNSQIQYDKSIFNNVDPKVSNLGIPESVINAPSSGVGIPAVLFTQYENSPDFWEKNATMVELIKVSQT